MTFITRFSSHPFYGIAVAFIGALIITPDTVFMRLSEMDALQMLFWRGLAMAGLYVLKTFIILVHKPKKTALKNL